MTNNKRKVFSLLPKKFKAKYSLEERVPSSGIYECSVCENYTAFKKSEIFSRCEDCLSENRQEINKWYVTNEVIHFMSKNLNIEFEKLATFQIRLADRITELAGSMGFVYFHTIWFGIWIIMNLGFMGPDYMFDPFPFGLLTMIVSLEAIYLSTFIMISQNILSKQTELRAEHEYQINLKAEKEVAEILTLIKELKEEYVLTTRAESEMELVKLVEKKSKKIKKGHKKIVVEEKEGLDKEERLLKDAGIYMIKEPKDLEKE